MPTITRRFEWDAGHRVLGHEGHCANLHGHRYVAFVQIHTQALDSVGRVIDFSVLKKKVGDWINANWDHNFLCHRLDPLVAAWNHPDVMISHTDNIKLGSIFNNKPLYIMPHDMNPTAENMAFVLKEEAQKILQLDMILVDQVELFETPNCWATA